MRRGVTRIQWTESPQFFVDISGPRRNGLMEISMSSKRYTDEFKVEAIRQVTGRGLKVAEAVERLGVTAPSLYVWLRKLGKPGFVQRVEQDQGAEVRRLKAELRRVKHKERDILKKAAVSSTGRCGIITDTSIWMTTSYGEDGTTWSLERADAGALASVETKAIAERHWPSSRPTCGFDPWCLVNPRRHCSRQPVTLAAGPHACGAERHISWACCRTLVAPDGETSRTGKDASCF